MAIADVRAQHAGIVAVAARMRHAVAERQHAAVGRDRHLRMPHDPIDVVVAHEVIDHLRAPGEEHLAGGLELRVGGVAALRALRDLLHRQAVE